MEAQVRAADHFTQTVPSSAKANSDIPFNYDNKQVVILVCFGCWSLKRLIFQLFCAECSLLVRETSHRISKRLLVCFLHAIRFLKDRNYFCLTAALHKASTVLF